MTQPNIDDAQIRETAYLFWLDEGQPQGRDQDHWLKAINVLTPAQTKAKLARKAPAKKRAATVKAPPKTAAAKKPRASKSTS